MKRASYLSHLFRASFTNEARASMRVDTRDSTGAKYRAPTVLIIIMIKMASFERDVWGVCVCGGGRGGVSHNRWILGVTA